MWSKTRRLKELGDQMMHIHPLFTTSSDYKKQQGQKNEKQIGNFASVIGLTKGVGLFNTHKMHSMPLSFKRKTT